MVAFYRPKSLADALKMRHGQLMVPLAGGTDLMVRHRGWAGTLPQFDQPILYLGDIEELKMIREIEDCLFIGAAATLADLLAHPSCPMIMKEALDQMASPAIRNVATMGGNICNASPAADTIPLLYAAGASVELRSLSGIREIPIESFILGPGRTALADNELLTTIRLPLTDFNLYDYRKIGTRKANALSKLSFIGQASIHAHVLEDIRIAFGAVAPTVIRSQPAEALLRGQPVSKIPALAAAVQTLYGSLIVPIDDQRSTAAYRKTVALQLLADFLARVSASPY